MADLRGKKASESVTNYQIYSNSWTWKNESGSFYFSFPKKIISGYITVKVDKGEKKSGQNPYVNILGTKVVYIEEKNINIPSGTSILNGTYFTGYYRGNNSSQEPQTCIVDIKFTGEWEL